MREVRCVEDGFTYPRWERRNVCMKSRLRCIYIGTGIQIFVLPVWECRMHGVRARRCDLSKSTRKSYLVDGDGDY